MTKLYHYTDEGGLKGIFFNKQLWVSLTSKSRNDKSDTIYIKQVIEDLKNEVEQSNLFTLKALEVIKSVLNPQGDEAYKDFLIHNVFMFCVNEIDNDNKMKSEFGCKKLVFEKEKLVDHFTELKKKDKYFKYFEYGKVIYDVDVQKQYIQNLIKDVEMTYKDCLENGLNLTVFPPVLAATPTNDYSGNYFIIYRKDNDWHERYEYGINEIDSQSMMWTYLANQFYKIAPFIKNPCFKDEKEYRFSFYREKHNPNYEQLKDDKYIVLDLSGECLIEYIELDK